MPEQGLFPSAPAVIKKGSLLAKKLEMQKHELIQLAPCYSKTLSSLFEIIVSHCIEISDFSLTQKLINFVRKLPDESRENCIRDIAADKNFIPKLCTSTERAVKRCLSL